MNSIFNDIYNKKNIMSNISNKIRIAIREAEEPKSSDEENSGGMLSGPSELNNSEQRAENAQYDKIQVLLGDTIFNHAAIIKRLWGDDNATYRSEFGKRLKKQKIDDSVHVFSNEEISAIASILQNEASTISGELDGPSKDERGLEDNYGPKR